MLGLLIYLVVHLLISSSSSSSSFGVLRRKFHIDANSTGFVGIKWCMFDNRMGEDRGVYRVLVGKPEGKRPLGIPRRR